VGGRRGRALAAGMRRACVGCRAGKATAQGVASNISFCDLLHLLYIAEMTHMEKTRMPARTTHAQSDNAAATSASRNRRRGRWHASRHMRKQCVPKCRHRGLGHIVGRMRGIVRFAFASRRPQGSRRQQWRRKAWYLQRLTGISGEQKIKTIISIKISISEEMSRKANDKYHRKGKKLEKNNRWRRQAMKAIISIYEKKPASTAKSISSQRKTSTAGDNINNG